MRKGEPNLKNEIKPQELPGWRIEVLTLQMTLQKQNCKRLAGQD